LIVVAVVAIYFAFPNISSFIQQSGSDKVTLPIGTVVAYNQKQGTLPEYSFRYGSLLGDDPGLLQVWSGTNTFNPKDFTVNEGSTYSAFAIQITISEVHSDYIVILVKHLS
jgi:hypothetical protein